jgi:hypothetical protein
MQDRKGGSIKGGETERESIRPAARCRFALLRVVRLVSPRRVVGVLILVPGLIPCFIPHFPPRFRRLRVLLLLPRLRERLLFPFQRRPRFPASGAGPALH